MISCCAVIPVYNHEEAVGHVLQAVLAAGLNCVLVNDGSRASCARVLQELSARYAPRVSLVELAQNQGKGGAMIAGLRQAHALGFSHALQIDADGQHDAGAIARFLEKSQAQPEALICGYPVYDQSVPTGRLIGRYATHIWVWINSLSFQIKDSMCGFRVYPLAPTVAVIDSCELGKRMDFDPEILIRLHWRGIAIVNEPIRVNYPLDGISHFMLVRDNLLISKMHAKLFFGMLIRSPLLLARNLRRWCSPQTVAAGKAQ